MLNSFFHFLEYEKRYSRHTLRSYRDDLRQFQEYLELIYPGTSLEQCHQQQIRGWVIYLVEQELTAKTVNRKLASLKSYFKYMQRRGEIKLNPAAGVKALKTPQNLPYFVAEKDMNRLLDQVVFPPDFQGKRDRLILEMLYGTGIRLSELIELRESDIQLFKKQLKVLGKRGKERVLPITDQLTECLSQYLEAKSQAIKHNADSRLIVNNSGKPAYPMFIYRTVRKYLDAVTTIEKRSPHILRHTFATHLLNKGADLNAVKDLLGHANLAATQVYTHNSVERLKRTFDQAHPKA